MLRRCDDGKGGVPGRGPTRESLGRVPVLYTPSPCEGVRPLSRPVFYEGLASHAALFEKMACMRPKSNTFPHFKPKVRPYRCVRLLGGFDLFRWLLLIIFLVASQLSRESIVSRERDKDHTISLSHPSEPHQPGRLHKAFQVCLACARSSSVLHPRQTPLLWVSGGLRPVPLQFKTNAPEIQSFP